MSDTTTTQDENDDSPCCDPGALSCKLDEEHKQKRMDRIGERLLLDAPTRREFVDDGMVLEYEPTSSILHDIADFLDGERECCPFFEFQLTIPPDHGHFHLKIGGSPKTRRFLQTRASRWLDT